MRKKRLKRCRDEKISIDGWTHSRVVGGGEGFFEVGMRPKKSVVGVGGLNRDG